MSSLVSFRFPLHFDENSQFWEKTSFYLLHITRTNPGNVLFSNLGQEKIPKNHSEVKFLYFPVYFKYPKIHPNYDFLYFQN